MNTSKEVFIFTRNLILMRGMPKKNVRAFQRFLIMHPSIYNSYCNAINAYIEKRDSESVKVLSSLLARLGFYSKAYVRKGNIFIYTK